VKIQTRAKINLFLEVLYKRPDGYHEIDTVFQSIALSDELLIEKQTSGLTLTVNDPSIPGGKDNLVGRVYHLLQRRFPERVGGARIHLKKRIPPGAGLGGGSADAAAALQGLNRLFHLNLSDTDLYLLAGEMGMDVPFCLMGGTAQAAGRGDLLVPLQRQVDFQTLVVHPGFSVSTRMAYESLRLKEGEPKRRSEEMAGALRGKEEDALWPFFYNRFEEAIMAGHPILKEIKSALVQGGCRAALLTGSGSAVCGYAPPARDLEALAAFFKERYPFVALTRPVNSGVVFDNAV
jgi:4-diphosphocytidyl-2-C-methyl-D-erythritol kinase